MKMIRLGQILAFSGIFMLFIPFGKIIPLIGLVLTGFGCAPVYPCMLHSIPQRFGTDNSQSMIGVQMAATYTGTCFMPLLFGLAANHLDVSVFPFYLTLILLIMVIMHELALKRCNN